MTHVMEIQDDDASFILGAGKYHIWVTIGRSYRVDAFFDTRKCSLFIYELFSQAAGRSAN